MRTSKEVVSGLIANGAAKVTANVTNAKVVKTDAGVVNVKLTVDETVPYINPQGERCDGNTITINGRDLTNVLVNLGWDYKPARRLEAAVIAADIESGTFDTNHDVCDLFVDGKFVFYVLEIGINGTGYNPFADKTYEAKTHRFLAYPITAIEFDVDVWSDVQDIYENLKKYDEAESRKYDDIVARKAVRRRSSFGGYVEEDEEDEVETTEAKEKEDDAVAE